MRKDRRTDGLMNCQCSVLQSAAICVSGTHLKHPSPTDRLTDLELHFKEKLQGSHILSSVRTSLILEVIIDLCRLCSPLHH